MLTHLNNFLKIIEECQSLPELMQIFQHCIRFLEQDSKIGIAVRGSLACGEADFFSDIDLLVHVPKFKSLDIMQKRFIEQVHKFGKVLTWFRAVHINKTNLLVFYLKVKDVLVKIDADIECLSEPIGSISEKLLILNDVEGIFSKQDQRKAIEIDFNDVYNKFCVWLWYIYCRIARGELFQAARSIDFSREHALLPLIRKRYNLPIMDGHCRIELLLSETILTRLRQTYPTSLDMHELTRALFALLELFSNEWQSIELGDTKQSLKLLNEMKSLVISAQNEQA